MFTTKGKIGWEHLFIKSTIAIHCANRATIKPNRAEEPPLITNAVDLRGGAHPPPCKPSGCQNTCQKSGWPQTTDQQEKNRNVP